MSDILKKAKAVKKVVLFETIAFISAAGIVLFSGYHLYLEFFSG
jgi:hypothetical protein